MSIPESDADRLNELIANKARDAFNIGVAALQFVESRAEMIEITPHMAHTIIAQIFLRAVALYRINEMQGLSELAASGTVEGLEPPDEAVKTAQAFYERLTEWATRTAEDLIVPPELAAKMQENKQNGGTGH